MKKNEAEVVLRDVKALLESHSHNCGIIHHHDLKDGWDRIETPYVEPNTNEKLLYGRVAVSKSLLVHVFTFSGWVISPCRC